MTNPRGPEEFGDVSIERDGDGALQPSRMPFRYRPVVEEPGEARLGDTGLLGQFPLLEATLANGRQQRDIHSRPPETAIRRVRLPKPSRGAGRCGVYGALLLL